tara:strand:- start:484 stop:717 length:234 start_codon:yes stop_codon:yes gene_type:complete
MSIEDLIDSIADQNFAKAEPMFHDLLNAKMGDALETEKIKVADQVFNDGEEEQLEMDFDDEDLDDEDLDIDTEETKD